MARSEAEDFIQSFRFQAIVYNWDNLGFDPFIATRGGSSGIDGEAGFQQITMPEISTELTEYREGIFKWTRKLPGPPTIGDATFMRGLVKSDTGFFDWVVRAATGGDYRVDIAIFQFARADIDPGVEEHVGSKPSRTYKCYDSFPTRVKPGGDLDSSTGDVSIAEMDVAIERIELEVKS